MSIHIFLILSGDTFLFFKVMPENLRDGEKRKKSLQSQCSVKTVDSSGENKYDAS